MNFNKTIIRGHDTLVNVYIDDSLKICIKVLYGNKLYYCQDEHEDVVIAYTNICDSFDGEVIMLLDEFLTVSCGTYNFVCHEYTDNNMIAIAFCVHDYGSIIYVNRFQTELRITDQYAGHSFYSNFVQQLMTMKNLKTITVFRFMLSIFNFVGLHLPNVTDLKIVYINCERSDIKFDDTDKALSLPNIKTITTIGNIYESDLNKDFWNSFIHLKTIITNDDAILSNVLDTNKYVIKNENITC